MKNTTSISLILIATAISFSVISCKRDKEEETIPVANITISNPVAGSNIDFADTAFMDVNMTCPAEMHGYDAMIINLTANDTVWDIEQHAHATIFELHDFWVNDVTAESDMRFIVIAEVDHEGHTQSKSVDFHCHPN